MKKINSKILHLPPYLSTSWNHITALHVKENQLIISLIDGENIAIPHLPQETLDVVFKSHGEFLDLETRQKSKKSLINGFSSSLFPFELPEFKPSQESSFQLAFGGLEQFGSLLQHNLDYKNAPLLPQEMLNKISEILKIVSPEQLHSFSKGEPHCNCFHCQIAKSLHGSVNEEIEEVVEAIELQFKQYDIQQTGDKMFTVIDRLDTTKQYNVFLGTPIGCTCGEKGCEHIIAVLET